MNWTELSLHTYKPCNYCVLWWYNFSCHVHPLRPWHFCLRFFFQDISAHESNILGSFCDMNVSKSTLLLFHWVQCCFLSITWHLQQEIIPQNTCCLIMSPLQKTQSEISSCRRARCASVIYYIPKLFYWEVSCILRHIWLYSCVLLIIDPNFSVSWAALPLKTNTSSKF